MSICLKSANMSLREGRMNPLKIRCSAIGKIMTNPRSKKEWLSKACTSYLCELYVKNAYGREQDIQTKYTKKGTQVEEDSLTLYSRYEKKIFIKNEDWLQNDFITGTPDIVQKGVVHDIKSSWNIYTFFQNKDSAVDKGYWWQLQGYMALTGARAGKLVYCLVNTPFGLIEQEKRSLMYKTGMDEESDLYKEACREIEKLCVYDDIPVSERVIIQEVERDDKAIESIYKRVEECRKWMSEKCGEVKE